MVCKSKKLALLLVMVMGFSCCFSSNAVVAAENNKLYSNSLIEVYSPEFPDAYIETDFLDLRDLSVNKINGKMFLDKSKEESSKLNQILDNNPKMRSEILENVNDNSKKLIGLVNSKAYFEEKYKMDNGEKICTSSKLLSKDEINKIGKKNFQPDSDSSIQAYDDASRGELDMTFTIRQNLNTSKDIEYELVGGIMWCKDGSMIIADPKTNPAVGDDFLGFAWGGNYSSNSEKASGRYSNNTDIKFFDAEAVPNVGYVWSFNEYKGNKWSTNYAKYLTVGLDLYKNKLNGDGNDTSAMFKYIHTYDEEVGSVTMSGSLAGPSAGFSLSTTNKQWSLCTKLGGLVH